MNQVDREDQRRAAYPLQQRQQKGWKAIFYTIIGIVVVNSYLLSTYTPVSKEKKFTEQIKFREALCKALFDHSTGVAAAAAAYVADAAATANVEVGHHRVSMKRAPCVICKQGVKEGKRGIRGQKRHVLQAISPNFVSKRKDRHGIRVKSGCDSCKVALCSARAQRGCWEAFHSGAILGGKSA